MENYIEGMLIEEYQQPLDERRSQYWDRFFDSWGTVCEDNIGAVHEYVRNAWHRVGYTVERDSSRQGEKGTALVIQRISAPKKRHYAEAGLVVNGKRAKTVER